MEKKAIRLVSQKPMRETEWTTPNGEKKVIASKELEFSDGIDSFLAEAQDEMARSLEKNPLADGTVVNLQLSLIARSKTDHQTGEVKQWTNIRIQKLAAV